MTESLHSALSNRLALLVTVACGAASLAFMFMVGRQQKSLLLIAIFTVWVAVPFAAFLYMQIVARRRAAFDWIGAGVSLLSAAVYAVVAFGPPQPQPAKFFLLVPAASWVALVIATLLSRSK
jgi:hypothetical protein